MSDTYQAETPDQPPTTSKAPRVSQHALANESIPITKKHGADSTRPGLRECGLWLAREMDRHWLGVMPAEDFLDNSSLPKSHYLHCPLVHSEAPPRIW